MLHGADGGNDDQDLVPENMEDFWKEALVSAQFQHPNIVQLVGVGQPPSNIGVCMLAKVTHEWGWVAEDQY